MPWPCSTRRAPSRRATAIRTSWWSARPTTPTCCYGSAPAPTPSWRRLRRRWPKPLSSTSARARWACSRPMSAKDCVRQDGWPKPARWSARDRSTSPTGTRGPSTWNGSTSRWLWALPRPLSGARRRSARLSPRPGSVPTSLTASASPDSGQVNPQTALNGLLVALEEAVATDEAMLLGEPLTTAARAAADDAEQRRLPSGGVERTEMAGQLAHLHRGLCQRSVRSAPDVGSRCGPTGDVGGRACPADQHRRCRALGSGRDRVGQAHASARRGVLSMAGRAARARDRSGRPCEATVDPCGDRRPRTRAAEPGHREHCGWHLGSVPGPNHNRDSTETST